MQLNPSGGVSPILCTGLAVVLLLGVAEAERKYASGIQSSARHNTRNAVVYTCSYSIATGVNKL